MKDLKDFIRKHFGSNANCAEQLGVTSMTVNNWINKNPRGMLKYAPEIVSIKNITWTQLSGEVLFQEDELKKHSLELKD